MAQTQPQHIQLLAEQLLGEMGECCGYCGKDLGDMGGTEGIMRSEVKGRNTRLKSTGNRASSIPLFTLQPF